MPADPLSPVSPGDDALNTALSAAGINASRALLRRVRDQWPRERPREANGLTPSVEVIVRNDTGDDLEAYSVVVIQSDTVVDAAAVPYEFQGRPVFAVDEPSEDDIEQPVILSEPIPADGFGRAVISGHTLAYVWLRSTDYEYARPIRGDVTRLLCEAGGPIRILKKQAPFGSRILCSVELGLDCVDGWTSPGGHPYFGIGPTGGVYPAAHKLYERVATFYKPGYYLCWQPYHGKLTGNPPSNLTTQAYGAKLLIAWGKFPAGAPASEVGFIRNVCQAVTFAYPYPNFSSFQRISAPSSGGGVLITALRLDRTNLPYELGLTWGAVLEQVKEPIGSFTFTDYFTALISLGQFAAIRLPGIRTGGPQTWGELVPLSQPSPPDAPLAVAADDAYTVPAGGTLNVAPPGVLANDTVPAGYSAVLDSSPQYGTLKNFRPDGSFDYVQNVDLAGLIPPVIDTFAYHLSDGTANSQPATVTITITGGTTGRGGFAPVTLGDGTVVTGDASSGSDPAPSSGAGEA